MHNFDFLSLYPQVYITSKTRAKNKFGGFLSIINIFAMVGIIIFYFIRYFHGKEYNVKFLNQSTLYELTPDDDTDMARNLEFYIAPIHFIDTDCKLHPFYIGPDFFYDESNLTKCNDNLEIDPKGFYYCYNYSA